MAAMPFINMKKAPNWCMSPKIFLQSKLSFSEVVALMTSAAPQVVYWRTVGLGADRIRSDSTELAQGLDLLTAEGILTPNRKAEILS
jgi:hypothetical protein